jgi:hypothetical protein
VELTDLSRSTKVVLARHVRELSAVELPSDVKNRACVPPCHLPDRSSDSYADVCGDHASLASARIARDASDVVWQRDEEQEL